jgi:cell division protein FtsZ
MEVDEAANHIKDLVDPDANIIWGSAFNNDLEGKIRVSVVATGIDAEVVTQPVPAKVFAFPAAARTPEAPKAEAPAPAAVEPAAEPAPEMTEEPAAEMAAQPAEPEMVEREVELRLNEDRADSDGDELVLDMDSMMDGDEESTLADDSGDGDAAGTRTWLEEAAPQPPRREGGTLFERMSNIARGAAKAQVEEDDTQRSAGRDPLDIPRFLNRQNNQ